MSKVVGLHTNLVPAAAGEPNPELVKTIERLLSDATSGRLQAIAMAALYREGYVIDGFSPTLESTDMMPLLGGLEVCKATIVATYAAARPCE